MLLEVWCVCRMTWTTDLSEGTLGHDFDICAASGESAAWVLLWKTRSRPIGVRACPAAQFDFFSTAFDLREWTKVVFWKEDSGRQLRLITPENEGGDETSFPSHPKFTFFDDPDVPLNPPDTPLAPPDLLDRQIRLDYTRIAPSSFTSCWEWKSKS